MSSLEALLPDDLEKHVQLNRARLTSFGVLREEIKTYCECRGHANARNTKQKGSHPGGDDPMDIGAFGKGKGKGKGKQGQHGQDKDKSKDKCKMLELWKTWTLLKRLLEQEEHQRWFERKTQTKECRCSQS